MDVLFDDGGRYVVVNDGCPGLKLYDRLLHRVSMGCGAYYDNMNGNGRRAVEVATEDCNILNGRYREHCEKLKISPSWKIGKLD